MNISIHIPDEDILDEAKQIVAARVADDIFSEYRSGHYNYIKAIRDVVREVIKQDIDNLSDRAVNAAAKSIANRVKKSAIQKFMEEEDE